MQKYSKKTYCLAILTLVALVFVNPGYFRTNMRIANVPERSTDLWGEDAITRLKETGKFDSLSAAFEAARYDIEEIDGGSLLANNPENQMRAEFVEDGSLRLSGASENWQTRWRLKSIGRGQSQAAVGGGRWKSGGDRAELRRDAIGLTEYFENRPDGLEQGFIVDEKPAGDQHLRLVLQTDGELIASVSANGQTAYLSDASGNEVLSYDKLKVWDAEYKDISARMMTNEADEIWLDVDDANAAYPLTVDPTFVRRARLTASDGDDGDRFGESVAISGNTVVVGAPKNTPINDQTGAAYVFVLDGTTWSEQAKLVANDGETGDYFGASVSISGDTIVVGALWDNSSAGSDVGSAYVFVRNNTTWSPQEKLTAYDGAGVDYFGSAVSISGDTVVVGAVNAAGSMSSSQGAAYVFVRNGGVWTFQQKLTAGLFGDDGAEFGWSLSLKGGTVIIGDPLDDGGGPINSGAAYVFVRTGTTWSLQIRLVANDGDADDHFGRSVDISPGVNGATAVIGASNDDVAGNTDQGSAYVFNRSLGGTWSQTQKLIHPNGNPDDHFGRSVAVTPTTATNIFVCGDGPLDRAFAFTRVNSVWSQRQRLIGIISERYSSIATAGETVVVGALTGAVNGNGSPGAANVFKFGGSPFDFDGDEKTDIGIFRPSNSQWWINRSSDAQTWAATFGASGDRITPADFTGDGKADIGTFRPSNGNWYILRSVTATFYSFPFGANGDIPAPGDYDLDGEVDAAVFRPSTATWYIRNSAGSTSTSIIQFGANGDVPVAADYDGDGKADIAIFRPNGATGAEWWVRYSSNSQVIAFQFGNSTDKPVQGDYTGDGKADIAVWRPSNGNWFVLRSENASFYSFPFGASGDTPAPGDYDGDGRFDATVFRPSNATWYVQGSTAGTVIQQFGVSTDRPVASAFVP